MATFGQPFNFQSALSRFLPIVQQLQGALGPTPFQQAAVDTQRQTRRNIETMFANRQKEIQRNVGQALQGKIAQGKQRLAERGISGQAAALLGDFGAGDQQGFVNRQIRSSLMGQKLPHMLGISKDISSLLSGATDVNTRLLSSLLGQSGSFFPDPSRFRLGGTRVVGGGGGGGGAEGLGSGEFAPGRLPFEGRFGLGPYGPGGAKQLRGF